MFQQFCKLELSVNNWFPSKTSAVVSFIAFCFKKGYAASSITSSLSAISYIHKMKNLEDPTASFVVRKLLHGAAKLRPSHDQRAPVTKAILHQLVLSSPQVSSCYYNTVLTAAMYLLAFHAFLRIGEIAVTTGTQASKVLQLNQFSITNTDCTVVFHTFKHYQGPPVTLFISALASSPFCPVQAMKTYLAVRTKSPGPLFMFPGGIPVSKSFFGDQLKKSLAWAGLSKSSYKGHSFRIGAATVAAMQGISEEEIQRMGRWKSQAFKKYIRIPMLHMQ